MPALIRASAEHAHRMLANLAASEDLLIHPRDLVVCVGSEGEDLRSIAGEIRKLKDRLEATLNLATRDLSYCRRDAACAIATITEAMDELTDTIEAAAEAADENDRLPVGGW